MSLENLPLLLDQVVDLRHTLHSRPELAHTERDTAARLADFLERAGCGDLRTGLGGTGVAAVLVGAEPGPTVLLRCELDALPIHEDGTLPYASVNAGMSHKCGHDGHMAICAGVGAALARNPPRRGRVVLLFQPAEETGEGMKRVLEDPAFAGIEPDVAFAIHNLPGYPLGSVVLREGVFAWASVGLSAELTGATSHAAYPEDGTSPARTLGTLLVELDRLRPGSTEGLSTVIHARLGSPAFGTAPGEAALDLTLRATTQQALDAFREDIETRIQTLAARDRLTYVSSQIEPFPPTHNHEWCVDRVRDAAGEAGLSVVDLEEPFRWSEDFGHLAAVCPIALIGLGSGVDTPQLHHPDFDFDDRLIEPGVRLLLTLVEHLLDRLPPMDVPCLNRR